MTTKLMPFQLEDVQKIEKWKGRALIANEQGTGKSVIALSLIDRNPNWLPAVIVCPAHLKYNWQQMAQQHFKLKCNVLSGLSPDWGELVGQKCVIVNYDILYTWVYNLKAMKPKLVIADESQAVNNPEARRTQVLQKLIEGVPHFLPMSGTPITNRPIEFWPVLNMLDQEAWPSRYKFGHRYCKPKRNPWSGGWEFKGCSNAKELHDILTSTLMVRRLKKDVLKDLPEKMHNSVPLKLTKSQAKEYKEIKEGLRDWLRLYYNPAKPTKNTNANRSEALQRVNDLRQATANLKLPHVIDWITTFLESDEKLIVFATHRRFVKAIFDKFKKRAVFVNGEVSAKDRQIAFNKFNDDKNCHLFVGNVHAAGTGWSATACSNVAMAELPWRPCDIAQSIDRVHGIGRGQKGVSASIWYLLANDTLDESMLDSLKSKQKMIGKVVDGEEDSAENVFDDVIKKLIEN